MRLMKASKILENGRIWALASAMQKPRRERATYRGLRNPLMTAAVGRTRAGFAFVFRIACLFAAGRGSDSSPKSSRV